MRLIGLHGSEIQRSDQGQIEFKKGSFSLVTYYSKKYIWCKHLSLYKSNGSILCAVHSYTEASGMRVNISLSGSFPTNLQSVQLRIESLTSV